MGCGGSKVEDQIVRSIQEPSIRIQEATFVEKLPQKNEANKSDVLDEAMQLIIRIRRSFNKMDVDQNELLSREELKKGYGNGAFEISDEGIDYIMKNVDTDKDGNVNKG